MMAMHVIAILRVQVLAHERSAWLAAIMRHRMVGVACADAAWARARTGARARRRSQSGVTPFSGWSVPTQPSEVALGVDQTCTVWDRIIQIEYFFSHVFTCP